MRQLKSPMILMVLLGISSICLASDPEIHSVSIATGGMIIVNCDAGGGEYWLGATVETNDGDYIDLPPKRISGTSMREIAWRWGGYLDSFSDVDRWRVSIWEGMDGDEMRGRVDDTGWQTGAAWGF